MSEYLNKQAVLEWLESEMSINKGHPDDIDIHWTLNRVSKKILSGAFDANGEVQRLRAALEEMYEELKTLYFMVDSDDNIFHEQKKKYLSIIDHVGQSIAGQALSTTEPKQDKACVICGKREGKYLSTANRWFCEPCTDALPPVNANAEKMREGDGNE